MKINERGKEIMNSIKRKRENVLFFPNVKLQKGQVLFGKKEEIIRCFFIYFKEKERKKECERRDFGRKRHGKGNVKAKLLEGKSIDIRA